MTDYEFIDSSRGRITVVPHDDSYMVKTDLTQCTSELIKIHVTCQGKVYAYQYIEVHDPAVAESCIAAFMHRCDVVAGRSLDYAKCLETDELAKIYAENECTLLNGAIFGLSHILSSKIVAISENVLKWNCTIKSKPSRDDYNPRLSLLDIIPSHREAKIEAAYAQYMSDLTRYEISMAHNTAIRKFLDDYEHSLPTSVEDFAMLTITTAIQSNEWAGNWMGYVSNIKYAENDTLNVCYNLPLIDDLPEKSCKYNPQSCGHDYIPLSSTEATKLYDPLAYSLIIFAAYNIFAADYASVIRHVHVQGVVTHNDPATGNLISPCILSLDVNRDMMLSIRLAGVQPEACFKHLGGISAGRPSQMKPITPPQSPTPEGQPGQAPC